MTTIHAESLLKSMAFSPGRLAIGELYPAIDVLYVGGWVESSQLEWRTVWPVNSLYTFSTAQENMYVSSSSTLDVGRIIFVVGLNAQFNQVSGYGITNGQNQSIITSLPGAGTPVEFFRVNHVSDITPSTAIHAAQGNIYVAISATLAAGVPPIASTRSMIRAGDSRALVSVYTVPAGYLLSGRYFVASQDGDKQMKIRFRARTMFLSDSTILYLPDVVTPFASIVPGLRPVIMDPSIFLLPEMSDVSAEVIGTSPVSGIYTGSVAASLIDYRSIKNLRLGVPLPG